MTSSALVASLRQRLDEDERDAVACASDEAQTMRLLRAVLVAMLALGLLAAPLAAGDADGGTIGRPW